MASKQSAGILLHRFHEERLEVSPIDRAWPEPEDEAAEIADRLVQGVDGTIRSRPAWASSPGSSSAAPSGFNDDN